MGLAVVVMLLHLLLSFVAMFTSETRLDIIMGLGSCGRSGAPITNHSRFLTCQRRAGLGSVKSRVSQLGRRKHKVRNDMSRVVDRHDSSCQGGRSSVTTISASFRRSCLQRENDVLKDFAVSTGTIARTI